jgi:hypothetical protein
MFVLLRAVTYTAIFIGFVLVYLPARFLSWSGIVAPASTGAPQVAGMIMVTIGTAIALMRVHVRVHRERHAGAVRSAKKTCDPWSRIGSCVTRCISAPE